MEASTQKHMLPIIQKFLAKNGPQLQQEILVEVDRKLPERCYFWPPDFGERLQRLVARGQLVKIKKPGERRCLYALPDGFPTEFDLTDPTARLVASDKAEESGYTNVAELLRTSRQVTVGEKKEKKHG